jgi:biopolymer transport protein ExbD
MRFPRTTKIFRGQIEAAPFLGVFFLLLIFILLNSALVFTPGVTVQLPEAADLPGASGPTLVVAVDRQGQFYFENQATAEAQLKEKFLAAVAQSTEPLTLIIQGDKEAKYGMMLQLELLARETGIKKVVQGTRPKGKIQVAPARL